MTGPFYCRGVLRILWGADAERFVKDVRVFAEARQRVIERLRELPLVEAGWRRPRVLTHSVTRERIRSSREPVVPFGWAYERIEGRNAVEIGPAWFILPRRWYRELRWQLYHHAIRLGAAEKPYEGCYLHELRWFPAQRWGP